MSLTQLIQFKTPVRDRLAADFPKPRLVLSASLRVAPASPNRALIGTAFDYLVRFHLQRTHAIAMSYTWVAERALEKISIFGDNGLLFETPAGYVSSGDVRDRIRRYLKQAQTTVKRFVDGGPLSDDLIRVTLRLAYCDLFYRSYRYDPLFGRASRAQVNELRALISEVDWSQWRAKRCCLLNPSFGKGSEWIGGADADVLLDDTLIDIKTTANLVLTTKDWRQILCYAALNEHFPIGGSRPRRIRRLGFYFARYGYFITWPIAELVSPSAFASFAVWLRDHVREMEVESQKLEARYEQRERRHQREEGRARGPKRAKRRNAARKESRSITLKSSNRSRRRTARSR